MLRLSAGPPMIYHHFFGHQPGNFRPQILIHQGDGKVKSGGHPRRGPDRAVLNEDAVFLDGHFGMPPAEFPGVKPVRRRPAAVEKARLGQKPGRCARSGHAPGCGGICAQKFHQRLLVRRKISVSRHNNRVHTTHLLRESVLFGLKKSMGGTDEFRRKTLNTQRQVVRLG